MASKDDPEEVTSEDIEVTVPEPTSNVTKITEDQVKKAKKSHTPRPRTDPWEDGGGSCGGCGRIVPHGDQLGYWDSSSTYFTAVGYYCSKCEHRFILKKFVSEERKQTGKYRTMSGWEKAFWRTTVTLQQQV